jgi:hypothetical protein
VRSSFVYFHALANSDGKSHLQERPTAIQPKENKNSFQEAPQRFEFLARFIRNATTTATTTTSVTYYCWFIPSADKSSILLSR